MPPVADICYSLLNEPVTDVGVELRMFNSIQVQSSLNKRDDRSNKTMAKNLLNKWFILYNSRDCFYFCNSGVGRNVPLNGFKYFINTFI